MTSMALFQIINLNIFSTPFAIAQAYFLGSANWNKDAYRQAQEQFAQLFFNVALSGIYAGSFYCYCAASKRYRQQVLDALKKIFRCRNQERNRVVPFRETFRLTTTFQRRTTTVH
ncbi:unnamed protein product [Rotaria sordida]|uniref:Uncharacterized protein n=1 Tax=Rotaria sordida TaxID=392033 RepID=A0A814R9G0_9BILA|nr:unnamed protein product [Rotaria sordida]CAF1352978.1 unnamed protein product [Rotaria sordida]